MEAFLQFFEQMPVWQRAAWVFICLSFCWVLEAAFPLFQFSYNKWRHIRVNLVFLSTTMMINALFGIATAGVFVWLDRKSTRLNSSHVKISYAVFCLKKKKKQAKIKLRQNS